MVRVLEEENLARMFRERYLKTHESYLGSITDIITKNYGGDMSKNQCGNILSTSQTFRAHDLSIPEIPDEESLHFRNLRNAWYHECSLSYPTDLDTRIKFAAWKIIECYYAIFASVASLVRCIHPNKEQRLGHKETLRVYASELVAQRKFSGYFLTPANFMINQEGNFANEEAVNTWAYGREHKVPYLKKCLQLAYQSEKGVTTLVHYFKMLREWATYSDAYLFFRLYGTGVKFDLDRYLRQITFFYLAQAELFLLDACGWEAMKIQYDSFTREFRNNLKAEDLPLMSRFSVYSRQYGPSLT